MTDDFSSSFAEARVKFIAAAYDAKARLHSYGRDDLKGSAGERLACDVAVLGDEHAERAAIVITGTHGAEGFAGSAILHRWLLRRAGLEPVAGVKIVLLHALNCWGFSHNTRTTENNVDLNRNFLLGANDYDRQNPSYDKLVPFLHAAVFGAGGNLAAHRAYKNFLEREGWHVENEMLEGQSHRPDGVFYAGKGPEWSNRTFRKIVNDHLGGAERIGFIDWHTGVGSFGEIVYLIFDEHGSPERAAAESWWGRSEADKSAFQANAIPRYRGLVCQAIRQELPAPKIAGAVIEFGTDDDYALFRANRLDRWLWFEGRTDGQYARFRNDYRDACCPTDVTWRRFVLSEGPAVMDRLVTGVRLWRD